MKISNLLLTVVLLAVPVHAENTFSTLVEIEFIKSVYYTEVAINGIADIFMIDTGAGKTLINKDMYVTLMTLGDLHPVRDLHVRQADGSVMKGMLYKVDVLDIGECRIHDAFVAYVPSIDLNLLGLNTLEQVSPVVLDSWGSHILLSNCE